MAEDIFISYRRGGADQPHAGRIRDYLKSLKHEVYFDRDEDVNPVGVQFPQRIADALRHCSVIIAVMGERWISQAHRLYDENDWVRRELLHADPQQDRCFIPILLGIQVTDLPPLPKELGFIKTANLIYQWDEFEQSQKETLRKKLRRVLPDVPGVDRHEPGPLVRRGPPDLEPAPSWGGGVILSLDGDRYLLHDGVEQRTDPARAVHWQETAADRITGPAPVPVRLRQVRAAAGTPAREELLSHAAVLRKYNGQHRLPRVLRVHTDKCQVTVITALPAGRSWAQTFGPRDGRSLDAVTAHWLLATALDLTTALARLHQGGHSHRCLTPATLVVERDRRRIWFRDGGLVALAPRRGEGPEDCRAPEQELPGPGGGPGTVTDGYQLAALLYHTLTGYRPGGVRSLPVAASVQPFPPVLDDLLHRFLDREPARRPRDLQPLAAELDAATRSMGGGGAS